MAFKGKRQISKLVYWTILFQVKDIVDAGKIYRMSIKIIPLTFEQINKWATEHVHMTKRSDFGASENFTDFYLTMV